MGPPSSVRSKSKSAKDTLDTWKTDSHDEHGALLKSLTHLFGVVKENNRNNEDIIKKLKISVELLETKQHGIYGIYIYTWFIAWCPSELILYTLPETNIAHENPHLSWWIPSKWWIFHGYVSFREGKVNKKPLPPKSTFDLSAFLQEAMAMVSDNARATGVVCSIKLDLFFVPTARGLIEIGFPTPFFSWICFKMLGKSSKTIIPNGALMMIYYWYNGIK